MAKKDYVQVITVQDGVSASIPLDSVCSSYHIIGTATLTTGWSVGVSGTPYSNMELVFTYAATVTPGAYAITILGATMPTAYAAKKQTITCTYVGSAWKVRFSPSFDQTNLISTDHIIDEAVTLAKVEDLVAAKIIVGNASNRPTAVSLSGHATISDTGALTIANEVIKDINIADDAAIRPEVIVAPNKGRVVISNVSTGALEEAATTSTELAKINGVTPGTALANKAMILGASKDIDALDVTALSLSGTPVIATGDELNLSSGLTATTAELNKLAGLSTVANDLELISGLAAAGISAADMLAIKYLATVFTFTSSEIEVNSGILFKSTSGARSASRSITSDDGLELTDEFLLLTIGAGPLTLTLPNVTTCAGIVYKCIIKANGSTQNLVIDSYITDSIWYGGAETSTATITTPAESATIYIINHNGSYWTIGE